MLIVDADRAHQRTLADALVRQGYVVTVERDGEWAMKTLEKKTFDVLIIDPTLPSMHGFEVVAQLRVLQGGARTPVIFISAVYTDPEQQAEALSEYGAVGYLTKPVDLTELSTVLKKALGKRKPKPTVIKAPPPVEEDAATGEFMADDLQRDEVTAVEAQSRTNAGGPSLRGDFSSRPFAEVLAEVHRWRASGALLLRRQNVKKIVYFRNGTPESVKSNLLVECLGKVLVREKMISEAECEESLRRMKKSKRMQGTVLIDMGCLSPHNLQYALVLQLQEKLYDAFRWDTGEFQFNPAVEPPPEPLTLGMTTAQLIVEGVRRAYDAKRLSKALGNVGEQYVHLSDEPLYALQDAGLSDEETELMRMVDGHQTVSTLRALNVLSRLETDRLLFAMTCAQMVQLKDAPAPGKRRPSIAKIAAAVEATKPPPLPPPLPTQAPVVPPPLPPRTMAAPGLPLPWDNAELSQKMAPPLMSVPPPPPVDLTPPPRPSRKPAPPVEPPRPLGGSLLPELSVVMSMPKLSNEDSTAREKLAAKMAAMRKQDYFELLGV
ncbi:MAG: response regulator, partial [Archangium sp.]|nr:response regulator [Archangium sp.]